VRARLARGGVFCQWANAYNISDRDLRSIVATFLSVFPDGTLWLVGGDDVLMMASDQPLDERLERIREHWTRPGVAEDLAEVAVRDPFSLWSLYVGGPAELARYAQGSPQFNDDTMRLEFSAPRELHHARAGENVATLTGLLGADRGPQVIREARRAAGAAEWRNRGAMMAKSDVHSRAYDDFLRALELDVTDSAALDGLVRTAVLTSRAPDALVALQNLAHRVEPPAAAANRSGGTSASATRPLENPHTLVAISKLQAAAGLADEAAESARQASLVDPLAPTPGLEQMASVFADRGNTVRLDEVVERLERHAPGRAPTLYYAAVAQFLHGDADHAARLAERAIEADPSFAPVYDLAGAAYTRLGRVADARVAFERSLAFDAHDSSAYTNLGLLAFEAGDRVAARGYFAEALWLEPASRVARDGMARTK
ncbi:MAG: hypothetical protein OEW19_00300, partial [Acidobacteriota bacterium]|nr:hypothetical protein [Acidobacteriota bacterium]